MKTLHGLFGKPFLDLGHLLDERDLEVMDREITRGLLRVQTNYTGGSLKHMGVVAPWQVDDDYRDLMQAIREMSRPDYEELVGLGEGWAERGALELDHEDHEVLFGDETDFVLSHDQERWLELRHQVYFPWKRVYHLLENDRWEDKHQGRNKAFSAESLEVFPETIARIRALPFQEIGRVVVFGLSPNDHAPLHRDSQPGADLTIAQSISIDPRGDKRFVLQNDPEGEPELVDARVYWFNDMDYHGVLPDPFFRYSLRTDGIFERSFLRDLQRGAVSGRR